MSLPVIPLSRTGSVALTGTPTAIIIPAGIQVMEVRAQATGAWNYRFVAADAGYPVAALSEAQIPLQIRDTAPVMALLVDGTGTLSFVLHGLPK